MSPNLKSKKINAGAQVVQVWNSAVSVLLAQPERESP
jgi:hypothetical protein